MTVFYYPSPLGRICLAREGGALVGLWFEGQRYYRLGCEDAPEGDADPIAVRWLDAYFSNRALPEPPKLLPRGTAFQKRVWSALLTVPYGTTVSYGELASRLDCRSARAVGAAVGRNPISLMIPCHRVIGSNGTLTGYAGEIWRKKALLELERNGKDSFPE